MDYQLVLSILVFCCTGFLWGKGLVKRPMIKICLSLANIFISLTLSSFFGARSLDCVFWSVTQGLNLIWDSIPLEMQNWIRNSIVQTTRN